VAALYGSASSDSKRIQIAARGVFSGAEKSFPGGSDVRLEPENMPAGGSS
jgi:hypothetical protein